LEFKKDEEKNKKLCKKEWWGVARQKHPGDRFVPGEEVCII